MSPVGMQRKHSHALLPVRAGLLPVDRPQLQRDVRPGRPGLCQLRLHLPRHGGWSCGQRPRTKGHRWAFLLCSVVDVVVAGFFVLFKLQSHIPELETPLSERVRAFVDWLQDNRAFSCMIHVVK